MAEGGDSKDYHEVPLTLHITNLPPGASENETFEMYLENTTGEDSINIEYSDALNEALVMFENLSLDLEDIKTCIRQKPLLGSVLQVEEALPNNRVWVTNIKPGIDKEIIELYFDQKKFNPSESTVEVEYDDSNHAAIVTYSDTSAVKIVLSTDHSKTPMLGPNVVIEHCKFFDSLDAFVSDADSVGIDEPCMPDEHEGDHANEDETAETIAYPDTIGAVLENQGRGRGRGNRRGSGQSTGSGGRRGGRRGGRQGRGGFGPEGQIRYQRQDSASSQRSEPPPYGERSMGHDQGWVPRGNRRTGRWRGAAGDVGRPHYFRGRRPQSASRGDEEAVDTSNGDGMPIRSPASRWGEHPHYPPQRGRRGDGGQRRGQARDGMYQRAGSVPSLLDQPLTLPTGSISKEVEVKNEVRNEKCHLLTTMIRDVKSHGCDARVDMRRHCVVLSGPSSAVYSAAETVYSQMLDMRSVELELPARFAQLLATPRGHAWVVNLFRTAQLRAIYYTNENGTASIIAADESANSAKGFLMRNIKSVEIPYAKWQKTYLQSQIWRNFVDSAEKTWLLNIEVTLSNVICITGVEDDVNCATESIRSQLGGLEKPIKSKFGSASGPEHDPRLDELPGRQLPEQFPAALDPVEVLQKCPICYNQFPESSITEHVNLCISSKVCPICFSTFSSTTPGSVFKMHVNGHFDDSDNF